MKKLPTNKYISLEGVKNFSGFLLVFISRLVGFAPNFSPLGSFGFHSKSVLFFFASIIAFDFLKGGFYPGFLFTYLGFLSYVSLGKLAKTTQQKVVFLPVASFLFFLISNFGVWFFWYERSLQGLLTCYALALPFYKNTLMSDLVFGYGYLILKSLVYRARQLHQMHFSFSQKT